MSTQILRTSERRDFKRCQQRWWWGWREGLKPRGQESTPLWFGSGFHLGLAEWYLPGLKRGVHPAETFAKYAADALDTIKVADATEEEVAKYEDACSLGITLSEEYIKLYGDDPHMEFIQAEHPFRLPIPWAGSDRQQLYDIPPGTMLVDYCGTWDGVYRDLTDGKIKLLETKTAKAIQLTHLTLDDQAGSYYAIASKVLRELGLLGPREPIYGITYNFIRKALPDERPRDAEGYYTNKPVKLDYAMALGLSPTSKLPTIASLETMAASQGIRVLGERSKSQPPPIFHREDVHRTLPERNAQLRKIQDEAMAMQVLRDRLLPLTKNPTRDCSWDCSFFAMCELQDRGGAWEDFKRMAFVQKDPYADHRKSSDE
jgi:hypothetical protein